MSGIAIYMEGGGDGSGSRAALRQGMNAFLGPLREAARARAMGWKLVCCGSRNEAFRRFRDAVRHDGQVLAVLLVDAEERVTRPVREHLQDRDGWNLSFTEEDQLHLMVQTMETWIVADPEALRAYYGQHFNETALSRGSDLEDMPKEDIARSLDRATERTRKGRYHKIGHARDLLKRIDVEKVKRRCSHCRRLFEVIGKVLAF